MPRLRPAAISLANGVAYRRLPRLELYKLADDEPGYAVIRRGRQVGWLRYDPAAEAWWWALKVSWGQLPTGYGVSRVAALRDLARAYAGRRG